VIPISLHSLQTHPPCKETAPAARNARSAKIARKRRSAARRCRVPGVMWPPWGVGHMTPGCPTPCGESGCAVRIESRGHLATMPQAARQSPRGDTDLLIPVWHAYEEPGVTGVPIFEIGSQVLTGLQDRETLEAVIEGEIKDEPVITLPTVRSPAATLLVLPCGCGRNLGTGPAADSGGPTRSSCCCGPFAAPADLLRIFPRPAADPCHLGEVLTVGTPP
jgi:hypothetical protein